MPTPMYLYIEGEAQGPITSGASSRDSIGSKSRAKHEDEIVVQALHHQVQKPVDNLLGQPTGPSQLKNLKITKLVDQSSPLLWKAASTGEHMKVCIIKWYRTSASGSEEHYFSTELEEAIITGMEAEVPNCLDNRNKDFEHMEHVYFSCRAISWRHEISAVQQSVDYSSQDES